MTAPATKTCCVCQKDVSGAKRVKDPQGRYYCAPCHEAALQRTGGVGVSAGVGAAANVAGGKSSVVTPPPPPGDELDLMPLVPLTTKPQQKPHSVAGVPAAEEAPRAAVKIPEFCPACGTKTLPGRRLCFKCNRDTTQLDKLVAMREAEAGGSKAEEKFASAFGVVAKIGLWVFCIAVVAFVLYGVYLQVKPVDTFEDYPTTREKVVRDFLKHIDQGSDKSFDKAFLLVSFRERTTNNTSEDVRYKDMFRRMREDFISKYGTDWHSKYTLENAGPNDNYADDEVDFTLKLGEDKYTVATQVQIAIDVASVHMLRPSKVKPEFAENGKNHFGVLDISGYKVRPKRTMDERLGITARQRPEF